MTFDQIKLSSVLTLNTDFVEELENQNYKRLSVRLYGNGIEVGEIVHANSIVMKKHQIVETGQVVLSMMWGKKGAIGVVPDFCDGGIITTNFYLFDINTSKIETTFLNWIFRANYLEEQLMAVARGTASNATTRPKQLLECLIPLPPLTEQRRIVTRIEALAARVTVAQSLRRDASEEAELLLYSAMRQIFKTDGGPIVHLEKTCSAIIDNLHSNPDYSGECTVPCIRSSDVGWGELFLETARQTSEEEYTHRTVRGEPTENDIVLVREGGGTGKAALVEKQHRFSLGQRVMMLRPNLSVVLPKLLLYQILSPFIYDEQIVPLSKGSASPHLNIGALRKFKFMLPPLPEQQRLVAYLDGLQAKVTSLRAAQAESERELAALMPSVLDRAFKGEL